MIDIHSHILPSIDDGARDEGEALAMARMAADDGISVVACTPHIWPPRFINTARDIVERTRALQSAIDAEGIALTLVPGADVHLMADLPQRLRDGTIATLNGSAAFLLEPDHDVLTPHLLPFCQTLQRDGYRPVLTHPERLGWIDTHFPVIEDLFDAGVLMQVTAGSLLGDFGSQVQRWAQRMLENGMVDMLASDAHNGRRRPPALSRARGYVAERFGPEFAKRLVDDNPRAVLEDGWVKRGVPALDEALD